MIIDKSKTYQTKSGQRVINLEIRLKNGAGAYSTFPIKGTIIRREKPLKQEYFIWTIRGEADPVWKSQSEDDLVEVKNELSKN